MNKSISGDLQVRLSEFKEKWTQIALSTAPADRPMAERGIRKMYESARLLPPLILWSKSPLAAGISRSVIFKLSKALNLSKGNSRNRAVIVQELINKVGKFFPGSIPPRVIADIIRSSIGENLQNCDGTEIESRITDILRRRDNHAVKKLVRDAALDRVIEAFQRFVKVPFLLNDVFDFPIAAVRNTIAAAIEGICASNNWDPFTAGEFRENDDSSLVHGYGGYWVENAPLNSTWRTVADSGYGQHDADELLRLDYLISIYKQAKEAGLVSGHLQQAQAAGWYLPHRYTCWVIERPTRLRVNAENIPHCETGPAIVYPDGWSIYALNGVVMYRENVMTPADQIPLKTILSEQNVDIRRELLRKVGISRFAYCGKEIDRKGTYTLIDMSLIFGNGIRYAPYLLMDNPSLKDTQHLEGVPPHCYTVQQAINWRASEVARTWKPELLS